MAKDFTESELEKLLEAEAVSDRELIDTARIEDLISEHLNAIDDDAQYIRKLLCLYAYKLTDAYNLIRLKNMNDENEATHIFPYIRLREKTNHVEMIWAGLKYWVERGFNPHSSRVKQYRSKHGEGTVNSAVQELKKYKLPTGDFSMRMFDGEPAWVHTVGEQAEKDMRVLRATRRLLTEIMYKKRSVITSLKKLSERFKNNEGDNDVE